MRSIARRIYIERGVTGERQSSHSCQADRTSDKKKKENKKKKRTESGRRPIPCCWRGNHPRPRTNTLFGSRSCGRNILGSEIFSVALTIARNDCGCCDLYYCYCYYYTNTITATVASIATTITIIIIISIMSLSSMFYQQVAYYVPSCNARQSFYSMLVYQTTKRHLQVSL